MTRKGRVRLLKAVVWLLCLTPLGWVAWRFFLDDGLGVDPVLAFEHWSGRTALTVLLGALAVTPLRRLTGFNDLQKVRRLVGLFAFFYVTVHFMAWLGLDQFFAWRWIGEDIAERPFITVGFAAFVLLIPLAVTSTKGWIRRLGKNWVRIHRLVYVSAGLGVIHYLWATKADNRWPAVAGLVLAVLLGLRGWWAWRRRRRGPTRAARSRVEDEADEARERRAAPAGSAARPLAVLLLGLALGGCATSSTSPGSVPSPHAGPALPDLPAPLVEGQHFAVYRGDGTPATLDDALEAAADVEVVFMGEEHDDRIGHRVQLELLEGVFLRTAADIPAGSGSAGRRPLVLSLEMFERDVQPVVDEYLDDLITEEHLLAAARPWGNYEEAYRPLVEFARAHDVPVVAANAPRRYVNRASRLGRESLRDLPGEALATLPPLPYPGPSEAYRTEWDSLMGDAARHMSGSPLDGQTLWDATMAHSVARALEDRAGALVLHLAGGFHVENGTGVPEALRHYRPGTRMLVMAVRAVEDPVGGFDPEAHGGRGDFVILTDESWRGGGPR